MSPLLQKQCEFAAHLAQLIEHARVLGYRVKIGEVMRSDEQAEINALGFPGREAVAQLVEAQFPLLAAKIRNNRGNGIRNSVHCLQLAADLQIFDAEGHWLQTEYAYGLLADFWEMLGPDHKAGVRWGDTPHYSIAWNGAK